MSNGEKKGFLSSLFGGKSKKQNNERETPIPAPQVDQPAAKSQRVATQVQEPPQEHYDVERTYMNKEESQEIYGAKSMRQNVFLYAPPSIFLTVQEYVNRTFESIYMVGTSSIGDVINVYKEKMNVSTVIIFAEDDQSVEVLSQFIGLLANIKSNNPELLDIVLAISSKVTKNSLTTFPHKMLLIYNAKDFSKISEETINGIMSSVVKKQPVYVKTNLGAEVPSKATSRGRLMSNKPFKLENTEELKRKVAEASKFSTKDVNSVLEHKLLNLSNSNDIKDISNLIPEMRVLKEYENDLNDYIKASEGRLSADEVNEILISKLELSDVQQEVFRSIFSSIIDASKQSIETMDARVRSDTRSDIEILDKVKREAESFDESKLQELYSVRESYKNKAKQGFKEYTEQVKIIGNAIAVRKQLIQETQLSIKSSIEAMESDKIDSDVAKSAAIAVKEYGLVKKEIEKEKNKVVARLEQTVNFVSNVLKNYDITIQIDDILIEKLIEDNKELRTQSTTVVLQADNGFSAIAKLMIANGCQDLKPFSSIVLRNTTLLITSALDLVFDKNFSKMTFNEYINSDHSIKPNIITMDHTSDDLSKLDKLVAKLKYTCKNYRKIVILLDGAKDSNLIEWFLGQIQEIVVLTNVDQNSLELTNKYFTLSRRFSDVVAKTVVLRNFDQDIDKKFVENVEITAGLSADIKRYRLKKIQTKEDAQKTVAVLKNC